MAGDLDVAFGIGDFHLSSLRVHSHVASRVANLYVAVLRDFDVNGRSNVLGVGLIPGLDILPAVHTNLRFVRRTHADVASRVANGDAGIGRNGFRLDVKIEIEPVPAGGPVYALPRKLVSYDVDASDDSEQTEQPKNQRNLAGRYGRRRLPRTAGHGALIQL